MVPGCQTSSLSPAALKILNLSVPAKLSARKKAILSLSFSSNSPLALRYAQPGDRLNRVIRSRMAVNRSLGTATSANWKIICRAGDYPSIFPTYFVIFLKVRPVALPAARLATLFPTFNDRCDLIPTLEVVLPLLVVPSTSQA